MSLSLEDARSLSAVFEDLQALGTIEVTERRAIICVVGEGLRNMPGIAARVFAAISDINIALISQGASSINLTFAVDEARAREAVERLHQSLFGNEDAEAPATHVQSLHAAH